jgi:molecular chaperone GrpE
MTQNEKDTQQEPLQENEQNIEEAAMMFNADDSVAGTNHLNDALEDQNDEQYAKLEAAVKEANEKYLRLAAEFDNFRKRNIKERSELIKNASEDLIKSLLEVVDDSDRALEQIEKTEDVTLIKEGISLVFSKFKNILATKGLQEMNCKGEDFDADKHEAITEIPAPSEEMVGKVIDEVIKGYYLNDKIIRYAKVVVGK